MMTSQEAISVMYQEGRRQALNLQSQSETLTGTELNSMDAIIPTFASSVRVKNMLERNAGRSSGFICISSAGRVVRLLQRYDSDTYPGEPETLPAQWGFVWSTDPKKAKPFLKSAESPYNIGECCTENIWVFSSLIDNNVFSPSEYPSGWKTEGTIEDIIGG